MARVFISYAKKDATLARTVHQWLAEAGHNVFLDGDLRDGIMVGEQWEQRLYERLHWADAVVCVITSDYLASMWCTAEMGIAQSLGTRLLPLYAETDVAHPMLRSTQHTDLARDPTKAQFALVEALRRFDRAGQGGQSPVQPIQDRSERDRAPAQGHDRSLVRPQFGKLSHVTIWLLVSAINLVFWAGLSVSTQSWIYPWWIWIAGPWGMVLLITWIVERLNVPQSYE